MSYTVMPYLGKESYKEWIYVYVWAQIVKTGSDGEDSGLTPRLRRSPGEGNGYSPHYSYVKNPMDRGVWQALCNKFTPKSQQDPLWPTSQDIRNKSKNKQMGPNET